jgi:hypothetical protein
VAFLFSVRGPARAERVSGAAGIVDALVSDFYHRVCRQPNYDPMVVCARRRYHKARRPMPENHTAETAPAAMVIL